MKAQKVVFQYLMLCKHKVLRKFIKQTIQILNKNFQKQCQIAPSESKQTSAVMSVISCVKSCSWAREY